MNLLAWNIRCETLIKELCYCFEPERQDTENMSSARKTSSTATYEDKRKKSYTSYRKNEKKILELQRAQKESIIYSSQ